MNDKDKLKEILDILKTIRDDQWIEDNPEEGSMCFYCGSSYSYNSGKCIHRSDCLTHRIDAILAD